jgi:hypothetical protein
MNNETWYGEARRHVRRRMLSVVVIGLLLGGMGLWTAVSAMSANQTVVGLLVGAGTTAVLLVAVVQVWRLWQQPVCWLTAVVMAKSSFKQGGAGGGSGYTLQLRTLQARQATPDGSETILPQVRTAETEKYLTTPLIHSLVSEGEQIEVLCTTRPKRIVALWEDPEKVEE